MWIFFNSVAMKRLELELFRHCKEGESGDKANSGVLLRVGQRLRDCGTRLSSSVVLQHLSNPTLLQDLTQDSATLTGGRRTHRSGEGKMIALYGRGICSIRYRITGNFRRFFSVKKGIVRKVGSNSHSLENKSSPLHLDHGFLLHADTKFTIIHKE
jgi:hypothetical protein